MTSPVPTCPFHPQPEHAMPSPITCPCGESFDSADAYHMHAMTCRAAPSAGRWGRQRPRAEPAPHDPERLPDYAIEPDARHPLAFGDPVESARARDRHFQARETGYEPAGDTSGGGGGVATGLGMMAVAVVWFMVALIGFDTICFYPPFLFIAGLVTCFSSASKS